MSFARLFALAWRSLARHPLRSLLTALGIMFGVASVVAMLAVGEGASQEVLDQIRRMGSRNILLASVKPAASEQAAEGNQRVLEYGLLDADADRIRETVPRVSRVGVRRDIPAEARYGSRKAETVLMGANPDYASVANLRIDHGRFLEPADGMAKRPVAVLGAEVAERLFSARNPVGEHVFAKGSRWRVIGVLARRGEGTGGTAGLGGESDTATFVPLETMDDRFGETIRHRTTGSRSYERVALHRVTVESETQDDVEPVAAALRAIVDRFHPREDVRVTVPLELLRQVEATKRIFTLVLALIAAISLVVGGIGIMNIMLAGVVERTREIGIRRALGARRGHIVRQFLAESVLLSLTGGAIGLALGFAFPLAVEHFAGMKTVVTPWSLVLAFGISTAIGIVFGIYPAARAADLDPVEALRHE